MNVLHTLRGFLTRGISVPCLSLAAALYLAVCTNASFWESVQQLIPLGASSLLFYSSLFGILVSLYALILNSVTIRGIGKGLVLLVIILAGGASYFMDTFGIHIDRTMLVNVMLTDLREASDFFTFRLFRHSVLYIVLPVLILMLVPLRRRAFKQEATRRLLLGVGCLIVGSLCLAVQYKAITSFFRTHGELKTLINPASTIQSGIALLQRQWRGHNEPLQPLGQDARLLPHAGKPRLVVLVVGETARAANWGLNGYERQTTPVLETLGVINFPEVSSCGTATAVSLPCMFSAFPRSDYTDRKGAAYENLVDILNRAGIRVLWRDNDSGGSKGVANRIGEEKLYDTVVEGLCNSGGCYDAILLASLDQRLKEAAPGQDILLVLHQKGSHGPSYYQRYPAQFKKYTPECLSSDLQQCTQEEIVNTYDNTIAYTDFFLGQVAATLEGYSRDYDVAMLYVSDHGESLGEYGLYLHGVPYMIAPKEQTRVPMVVWMPEASFRNFGVDRQCLQDAATQGYSHDNLFHSVLGLMGVETSLYTKNDDIFAQCRSPLNKVQRQP